MVFQRTEIPDSEDEPLMSSPAQLPLLVHAEAPLASAQASQDAACEGQAWVTDAGQDEAERSAKDVLDGQDHDETDMQSANGGSECEVGVESPAAIAGLMHGPPGGLKPCTATEAGCTPLDAEVLDERAYAEGAESEKAKSGDGMLKDERSDTAASESPDPATISPEQIMDVGGMPYKKPPALQTVSDRPVLLTLPTAEATVNDFEAANSADASTQQFMRVDDTPSDDIRRVVTPTGQELVSDQSVQPSSEANTTTNQPKRPAASQLVKASSPPVVSSDHYSSEAAYRRDVPSPEPCSTTVYDAVQSPSPRGESPLPAVSAIVESVAETAEHPQCSTNAEGKKDGFANPLRASKEGFLSQQDMQVKDISRSEAGMAVSTIEAQFLSLQGGNTPAYTPLHVEQPGLKRASIKPTPSTEQKTDISTTKSPVEVQTQSGLEKKRALQDKPEERPQLTPKVARFVRDSQEGTVAELKVQRAALIATLAALPNIQELIVEANDAASHSSHVSDPGPSDADVMAAADKVVKTHIKLLHEYNEIKDVGQGLMGLIADQRGVRIVEIQDEFGIGEKD